MATGALILVGPTGAGKSDLAIMIARQIASEIVSADSRQIYRHLDIGTAKPSPESLKNYPHHFIDMLEPDQPYSAGQFGEDARKVIAAILNRKRIPLVVGGSGLYLKALLEGFFLGNVHDREVRESLNQRMAAEGLPALYRQLLAVDPYNAAKIHPNNASRIIRALEVYICSGKTLSELQQRKVAAPPFPSLKFGMSWERNMLYHRIDQRVDGMIRKGLIDEVKNIIDRGYDKHLNSLNSVGYKEVIDYLDGKIDLEECVRQIKQNTRNYAKRQLTWFRADKDIHWYPIRTETTMENLAQEISEAFQLKSAP